MVSNRCYPEVLDILVKRASVSPEALEQQKKEEEERELNRVLNAVQDAHESLLRNPAIPKSIRKMLKEINE